MATVTVDDHDSRISYSPNWFTAGSADEYSSTTTGTRSGGSKATFKFTGTSISVYGTISETRVSQDEVISSYTIDGASPATYSGTPASKPQYRVLYYQSPKLTEGEHTLTITAGRELAFFWLDYIQYTPVVEKPPPPQDPTVNIPKSNDPTPTPSPDPPKSPTNAPEDPSTKSTTTKTTPSPTISDQKTTTTTNPDTLSASSTDHPQPTSMGNTTSTTTIILQGVSESPSASSPPSVTSGAHVPTGAIAGGVVGGVIVLVVIILYLIWRRHKSRAAKIPPLSVGGSGFRNRVTPSTGVTPFGAAQSAMFAPPVSIPGYRDDPNNSPNTGQSGQSYDYGYGYVTQGGTSSEKHRFHRSQPSQSQASQSAALQSNESASRLIYRDPSEASSEGGPEVQANAQPFYHMRAVPDPSQRTLGPVAGPSAFAHYLGPQQSYRIGCLYQNHLDDVPPAYRQAPPAPRPPY